MCRTLLIPATLFGLATTSLWAQDPRAVASEKIPVRDSRVLNVSLQDAVVMAIRNHPDIEVERINTRIRDAEKGEAEGDFDFTTFINTSYQENRSETQGDLFSSFLSPSSDVTYQTEERFQFQGGIRKKFDTGTLAEFTFNSDRVVTDQSAFSLFSFATQNPQLTEKIKIEVTQPLLKNGWREYNTAKIRIAENNQRGARFGVIEKVRKVVQDVEQAYWEYAFAIEESEVQKSSVGIARGRLALVQEAVTLGRLDQGSVVDAQLSVSQAEEQATLAASTVRATEERLRVLIQPMGAPVTGGILVRPLEALPGVADAPITSGSLAEVYCRRPDFQQAEVDVQNARIAIEQTWNQLLPQLDLKGSYSMIGVDKDMGSATQDMFNGETYEWRVALVLEYPLGNHAAKNRYRKALWQYTQARVKFSALARQISQEVSEGARHLTDALDRYAAARRTTMLAEAKLAVQADRLDLGKTALEFVLQAQSELARSRAERLRQARDYQKALVRLRTALGTTLDGYPIEGP